jgi:hypothetical protein
MEGSVAQQFLTAASSPRAFLHIPKSAGGSIHVALKAALPAGSLATYRMDASFFCDFRDFHLLTQDARAQVTYTPDDRRSLRNYGAISGHFPLPVLLGVTTVSLIGTIVREPRARLLSLYSWWRRSGVWDFLAPYRTWQHALGPLAVFLAEPRIAGAIDNAASRMLLHGDPRIPELDFIPPRYVEQIAAAAIERLDELGFVGITELGDTARHGIERLFGVSLESMRVNVTGEGGSIVPAAPNETLVSAEALDLVEQRTAADRIVYDHALCRAGIQRDERERLTESAFARQLVKFGDLLGSRATMVVDLQAELSVKRAAAAIQTIATVVPDDEPIIVVDDQQWGLDSSVDGHRVIPFLERHGEYWGLPPDSATAVRELERLRSSGVRFIAFGRPSFWWLDHYVAFKERLQATAACLARGEDIIIFDLNSDQA